MLETFVPSSKENYAVDFLAKMAEGFHPVRFRVSEESEKRGPVQFLHIPHVTNVAGAIRNALGKDATSNLDDMTFKGIQAQYLHPGNFDVVLHVAKRQWNQTQNQWENLAEDLKNGFLSMTYSAITGAIQKNRMF